MTETITLPREVAKRILRNIEIGNKLSAGIEMRREIEAALEQPQVNSPEIPEGWKLVPVEPTTKMIDAARSQSSFPAGVWRAMLAAAPKPPVVEQEPVAYYVMNGAALFQLFRSKSQAEALVYDLQKRHDLSGSPAHFHVVPLFINPQPKPLTEDERQDVYAKAIKAINNDPHLSWRDAIVFETERAHGIGGEA